jgi:hypothetical protein
MSISLHAKPNCTQEKVSKRRVQAEQWLSDCLHNIPTACGIYGAAARLLQAADLLPSAGELDLLRAAIADSTALRSLNPFLSVGTSALGH